MTPISSPHVLVLEDNPDDEELILRALRGTRGAPSAFVARDGVEGLERLRTAGTRLPDLVLVDLNMPRLSGFEFLRAVRDDAHFRHLPLVVFTSSRETRDIARAYEAGATAYVQKPATFDAFAAALRSIVHFWLETNEPPPTPTRRLQRLL